VVNDHETVTSDFTRRSTSYVFPSTALRRHIADAAGEGAADFIDASRLATGLLGDSIATNLFMLGYAWQQGLVPLSEAAILKAIELNGVAVEFNKRAFRWGRRAAHDRQAVERAAAPPEAVPESRRLSRSFDELVRRRVEFLTAYQDAAYASRYENSVRRVAEAEARRTPGRSGLAEAAARSLFKLMAYKDEYEVARLYAETDFLKRVADEFEGDYELHVHLAPPLLAERDPRTGRLKKREYGPWMLKAFGMLAKLRRLRGTPFDVFGRTEERRTERRLIADYEAMLEELIGKLDFENHDLAVELAALPQQIRGFGHIKEANLKTAKAKEAELLKAFRSPPPPRAIAAE
jgi:indolepyruvate ferredoxin oxidoreductase